MGALKQVLDKGSEMLDRNPATPFDVTRGLVNAIPFIGPNTAKQFEQSNMSIPVGMSLDSRNAGIETVDIPTKEALNAIKWSDLVGTQGASRAAESIGYGETPEFFDALDASMVGLGGLQAAKIAARVPRAAKFAVTQAAKDFAQASAAAAPRVVKPKGGNWETGAVEKALKPMKRNEKAAANLEEMRRVYPPDVLETMSPETRAQVERAFPHLEQEVALNNWIDRNLTNYVKKEMGTPEDPVRRLAEEGVYHFPAEDLRNEANWTPERIEVARRKAGFPAEGMAKSPEAQGWEVKTDTAIEPTDVGTMRNLSHLFKKDITEPWMAKVPDETKVYMANDDLHASYLGFDHILDVLRQDVAAGRIRPDQLNKVSMEQAVRRAYEFDQEQARKMAETAIKQQEGFPIYKDYGDEGYRWVELAPRKEKKTYTADNLPEGFELEKDRDGFYQVRNFNTGMSPTTNSFSRNPEESIAKFNKWAEDKDFDLQRALEYEGKTMGHCVGGYCPDVLEGRSRIYSLRDKRGEPHVTVEVQPTLHPLGTSGRGHQFPDTMEYGAYSDPPVNIGKEKEKEIYDLAKQLYDEKGGNAHDRFQEAANSVLGEMPAKIIQIKGKGNRKPKEDYIPFVQDFVRGGEWNDVGDLRNTGLRDINSDLSLKKYLEGRDIKFDRYVPEETYQGYADDFLMDRLYPKDDVRYAPPEEGMAAGGTPRYPTEQEREAMRKLRESFLPAVKDAERLKRLRDNMERSEQKKVSFSDNPDTMMLELGDVQMARAKAANDDSVHMAGGGISKLAKAAKAAKAEELVKLERAPAKTKAEIEAIAQRIAPQMTGEYVRESAKSAKTVAGKTKKQFEREKTLEHDIRPTGDERPLPEIVDIENLKGNVMMGIAGDPTITGKTVYGVAGEPLKSPAPQHGGPLYGLGQDDKFWASQLGAAQGVQNRAGALSQLYEAPVIGNYVKMGPDSYSYAQHFADTNLQNIHPERMTKAQIEGFNELVRKGSAKSGPRPSFAGIENPDLAYLQFAIDPELRKHFGNLMQMPTITQKFGLRSGQDVAHAVTEPDLRNLEIGVTGKSLGLMRPDVTDLKLSEHPTYSHDIPGKFMGGLKYPTPYELMFPDTVKAVRENPAQAPQEFGSFKMVGPRQIIDPQMIDEIKQYEEFIKKYTGKKEGGEITVKPKKMAEGGEITAEDLDIEERPL
jgi:hypothetical protein